MRAVPLDLGGFQVVAQTLQDFGEDHVGERHRLTVFDQLNTCPRRGRVDVVEDIDPNAGRRRSLGGSPAARLVKVAVPVDLAAQVEYS